MQGLSNDVVRWAFVAASAAYAETEAVASLEAPYKECLRDHGERHAFFVQDRLLVLGYRGTADCEDVVHDLDVEMSETTCNAGPAGTAVPVGVHAGFLKAEQLLQDAKVVDKLVASADTVIVAGHSLGGAVAFLKTLRLMWRKAPVREKTIICIGIASPLVGDKRLRQLVSRPDARASFHVIVNGSDGVPRSLLLVSAAKNGIEGLMTDLELRVDPRCPQRPAPQSGYVPIGTYHFLDYGLQTGSYQPLSTDAVTLAALLLGPMRLSLKGVVGDHGLVRYAAAVEACCAVHVPAVVSAGESTESSTRWRQSALKILARMGVAALNKRLPAGASVVLLFEDSEKSRLLTGVDLSFSASAMREIAAFFHPLFFSVQGTQHAEEFTACFEGVRACSGRLVVKKRASGWTLMEGTLRNTFFSLEVSTAENAAPRAGCERSWRVSFRFGGEEAGCAPARPEGPESEMDPTEERKRIENCLDAIHGVPPHIAEGLFSQFGTMTAVFEFRHAVPDLLGDADSGGLAEGRHHLEAFAGRLTLSMLEFETVGCGLRLRLRREWRSGVTAVFSGEAAYETLLPFVAPSARESLSTPVTELRGRLASTSSGLFKATFVVYGAPPSASSSSSANPVRLNLLAATVECAEVKGGLWRLPSSEREPGFYMDGKACTAACAAALREMDGHAEHCTTDLVSSLFPFSCWRASYGSASTDSATVPAPLRFLTDGAAFEAALLVNARGDTVRRLFKVGLVVADEMGGTLSLVLGHPIQGTPSTATAQGGDAAPAGAAGAAAAAGADKAQGNGKTARGHAATNTNTTSAAAAAATLQDAAVLLKMDAETAGLATGALQHASQLQVYVRMESHIATSALHVTDLQLALPSARVAVVYSRATGLWVVEAQDCALGEVLVSTLTAACVFLGGPDLSTFLRNPFVARFKVTLSFSRRARGGGGGVPGGETPALKWRGPLILRYTHGASSLCLQVRQDVLERLGSEPWCAQLNAQVCFEDLGMLHDLPADDMPVPLCDALRNAVTTTTRSSSALSKAKFKSVLTVHAVVHAHAPPTLNRLAFTLVGGHIFGFPAHGSVTIVEPTRDGAGNLRVEELTAEFRSDGGEGASSVSADAFSDLGKVMADEADFESLLSGATTHTFSLRISLGRKNAGSFALESSVTLRSGSCSITYVRVGSNTVPRSGGGAASYRYLFLLRSSSECEAEILNFFGLVSLGAIEVVPQVACIINAGEVVEWPVGLVDRRNVPPKAREGWESGVHLMYIAATVSFAQSAVTDFFRLTGTTCTATVMKRSQTWRVSFAAGLSFGDIMSGYPTSLLQVTWSERQLDVRGVFILGGESSLRAGTGAPYMELTASLAAEWGEGAATIKGTLEAKHMEIDYPAAAVFCGGPREKSLAKKFCLRNVRCDVSISLKSPLVSVLLMARISINVAGHASKKDRLSAEGAVRVANGFVGLLYGHITCLSFATLVRIFADVPQSLVNPLNSILCIHRFGFIFKKDLLPLENLPGQRDGGASAGGFRDECEDNIILEALNRRSDEVVLKASEVGYAVGAEVTFLSVRAKCMLAEVADRSLESNRSMVHFKFVLDEVIVKLGKGGQEILRIGGAREKNLMVELLVSSTPKSVFAVVDASVSLFSNRRADIFFILSVNRQLTEEAGDGAALFPAPSGQSRASPTSFLALTKEARGVFFCIAVRILLFGDAERGPLPLSESEDVKCTKGGIVFTGRLTVRFTGALPDARLMLQLRSDKGLLKTLVKELLDERLKVFLETLKKRLQELEKSIDNSNMWGPVKATCNYLVRVANYVCEMARKMVNVVASVMNWVANLFDIPELKVGGMIGHGAGIGVQAAWRITLCGSEFSGSVSVYFTSVLLDLCEHLALFLVGAASKEPYPVRCSTRTCSDNYDEVDNDDDEAGQAYDFTSIPEPSAEYSSEDLRRDKTTLDEIQKAAERLRKKLSTCRVSKEECRKPSTEEKLQASHTLIDSTHPMQYKSQCPWCEELLDQARVVRHIAECKLRPKERTCPDTQRPTQCEFCAHRSANDKDIAEHYRRCTGEMQCSLCGAWKGKRCDWDAHVISDCARRDPDDRRCDTCGCVVLAGEGHTCPEMTTCAECEESFKCGEVHTCRKGEVCPYCGVRVSSIDFHLDRECLQCDLTCEKCDGAITHGKGKEDPMERRLWHNRHECRALSCRYCGVLVLGAMKFMDHEAMCASKFVPCNVDGCRGYIQRGDLHLSSDNTQCPYCSVDCYTLAGLRGHLTTACRRFGIACVHCGEQVVYCEYKAHLVSCLKVRLYCWGGCGVLLPHDRDQAVAHLIECVPLPCVVCGDVKVAYTRECAALRNVAFVADHWRDTCTGKPLSFPCPRCHQTIQDDLVTHLQQECKAFTVHCPFRAIRELHDRKRGGSDQRSGPPCRASICYAQVSDHLLDCPSVLVPCPFGLVCRSHDMTPRELVRHLSTECPAFMVRCPFPGCWRTMAKKDEEAHWRDLHCNNSKEAQLTEREGTCNGGDLTRLTHRQRALLTSDIPALVEQAELNLLESRAQVRRLVEGDFCCPRCGCAVPQEEKNHHLTYECEAGTTACPLKCGLTMAPCDVASHIRDSCLLAPGTCAHQGCYRPMLQAKDAGACSQLQQQQLSTDVVIPAAKLDEMITACQGCYDFFAAVAHRFASEVARHKRESSSPCLTRDLLAAQHAALYAAIEQHAGGPGSIELRKRHELVHALSCTKGPRACLFCWRVLEGNVSMEEHVNSCPDAETTIPCPYCTTQVALRRLVEHWVQDCDELQVPCPLKCGKTTVSSRTLLHLYTECPMSRFQCRCGDQLTPKSVFTHLVFGCRRAKAKGLVRCPQCSLAVEFADYVSGVHYTECRQYRCRCPLEMLVTGGVACGEVDLHAFASHLVPDPGGLPACQHVSMSCGKCGKSMHRELVQHHLLHECDKNFYVCGNAQFGCEAGHEEGEDGEREVLMKHYYLKECANFPMQCGKCDGLVGQSPEAQAKHLKESCRSAEWKCRCGFQSSRNSMILHRAHYCRLTGFRIHVADATHKRPLKPVRHELKNVHGTDSADWSHETKKSSRAARAAAGTALGGSTLSAAAYVASYSVPYVGLAGAVVGALCGACTGGEECTRCGKDVKESSRCTTFACGLCGERSEYTDDWCSAGKYAKCNQMDCTAYGLRRDLEGEACMNVCPDCGTPEAYLKKVQCVSMQCQLCPKRDGALVGTGCYDVSRGNLNDVYRDMIRRRFCMPRASPVPLELDTDVRCLH
ncbi:Lipase (class 3)/TRAF-type zinc finger containing protein [Novymonas esmeraldas]|uniref:Lipase (Class 3)/TRAF-type zinc finger containing protein n=1 Tax=Novymonas esmeraldas TaxID=1808958 RepID=A0AAW0ESM3_9TRYP